MDESCKLLILHSEDNSLLSQIDERSEDDFSSVEVENDTRENDLSSAKAYSSPLVLTPDSSPLVNHTGSLECQQGYFDKAMSKEALEAKITAESPLVTSPVASNLFQS